MFRKGVKKEKENTIPFLLPSVLFPSITSHLLHKEPFDSSLSLIIRVTFSYCASLHWDRSLRMEVLMPASVTLWTVLSNRSLGVERLHVPIGKGRPKLYLPGYKGDETLDALQTLSCDERQIKKHLSLFRPGGPATPYPAEMLEGGFSLWGD